MLTEIVKSYPAVLVLSFILDAIIGDPEWLPHPVRLMGRIISFFDDKLNTENNNNGMLIFKGTIFFSIFVAFIGGASTLLLLLCFRIGFWAGFAAEVIMSTYCLAGHDLIKHAMDVYSNRYDLERAKTAVSKIVGRDTSILSEHGVIKATVESVAENMSDGIIAPAMYIILFGAPGGMVYKAINTMDSMIGYHSKKYEYYGKPAAIADDIVNFIPSRVSAILIIAAAMFLKILSVMFSLNKKISSLLEMDFVNAFRIWRRDRRCHPSPNSAQTESAVAGALGLRLGGPAVYFGKTVDKPYIGEESGRDTDWNEIRRACILMYCATLLMVLAVLILAAVFIYRP